MKEEIWKDIEETQGYYQISNYGRVKSVPRFHKTKDTGYYSKEKILKPSMDNLGYLQVQIRKPEGYNTRNGYKTKRIHQLVAKAFIPNPNNYPVINHIDGNKSNNNVDNLEWCSHKYNVQHAFENGLHNPATRIPKRYRQKCDLAYEYIIRNRRKDGFLSLNEWQTEDLLKILEVNDAKR